jgi:hypothetical protein
MIKIGITLDDVIRAKTDKFFEIYKKYVNEDFDYDSSSLTTNNLYELTKFSGKKEYNKFLYEDYTFEIFGEADMVDPLLDKKLNLWHISLNDNENIDEEMELILTNPMEYNASIGYSYFFLSRMATRIREVYFPLDSDTTWDKCDILITADPKLLRSIPNNKVAIKINKPYNEEINGENILSFDSLADFISDNGNLENAVNTLISKRNNLYY